MGFPGGGWDPLNWVEDALKDANHALRPLEKWVLKQIVKAGNLIWADVRNAFDTATSLADSAWDELRLLSSRIDSLGSSFGGDLTKAWDWLKHEVLALVNDTLAPLKHEWDQLSRDAHNWVHDAEHYTDDVWKWADKHVLRPVENDLRHEMHVIAADADHVWHEWLRHVWAPFEHDLHEVEHDAKKAVYWIDHEGLDVAHLVKRAWDWLEWMAVNPFKAFEELPRDVLKSLSTTALEGYATTVTSGWDGLVAELDKVFPSD